MWLRNGFYSRPAFSVATERVVFFNQGIQDGAKNDMVYNAALCLSGDESADDKLVLEAATSVTVTSNPRRVTGEGSQKEFSFVVFCRL